MVVLDVVQKVAKNTRNENEDALKAHIDCKVVWKMLTAHSLKSTQCKMDGGSIISKIIEIERESTVNFEHAHAKTTNELEDVDNSKGKISIFKCDM